MFKIRFSIKVLCLLAISASFSFPANACLHLEGEKDNPLSPYPTPSNNPSIVQALTTHTPKEQWQALVSERRTVAEKEWDFRTQNNLSVALAHAGKLDEALERMQTVERTFPGHPYTAYNMGTVYELKSDLPHALEWVKKGIQREKEMTGHHHLDGTEWLHIKILEAAIKSKFEPDLLKSQSVLGLNFGDGEIPIEPTKFPTDVDGKVLTIAQVEKSLFEQLHERLEFVPSPNPIVADLVFDYANLQALKNSDEGTPTNAIDLYKMAMDYGPARAQLVQARFDYFVGTPNYTLLIGFVSIALCAAGWWQWNRMQTEKAAWKQIPVQQLDEAAPPKKAIYIDFSKYNSNDK